MKPAMNNIVNLMMTSIIIMMMTLVIIMMMTLVIVMISFIIDTGFILKSQLSTPIVNLFVYGCYTIVLIIPIYFTE